ncbi:histone-lysine N-methyltransferase 2A isoform X3 [Alosa sapidissima]|uniref:histone-lysine N-methyltransferase 2A isoform X3 n=1 Tax=Alosa sapidissima TaxID=34773 RepID=UPI001C0807B7|nr:histone-lysine N-methyltransferase 2A isoform X3 [Alosa sapidissima]
MAHSCRWRFPARPGGSTNSGTGKRAGRIRVTASLRNDTGAHTNSIGPKAGFDAAVQVSAAIESNLQKFRDVLGESSGSSSGEEEAFGGFCTVSEGRRIHSPARTFSVPPSAPATPEKKPRGRPPRAQATHRVGSATGPVPAPSVPSSLPHRDATVSHTEKVKRPPGRPPGSGEKRRGRPPASASHRGWHQSGHGSSDEAPAGGVAGANEHGPTAAQHGKHAGDEREGGKMSKLGKVPKLKRLQDAKMGPLKSRLKAVARKGVPVPVVPRRRRGRPPSAERLKAEAAAAAARSGSSAATAFAELSLPDARTVKQKAFRVRGRDRGLDLQAAQQQQQQQQQHAKLRAPHADSQPDSPTEPHSPPSSKFGRPLGLRQSPRHIKPVRIVPPSKRTDATIAKQLLQRAKKGAQKKKLLEKESVGSGGPPGMDTGIRRRRRTPLKNIRQFIMPVVSTVSRRIIKTPKRFIEDETSFSAPPPQKVSRLDTPVYVSASVATVAASQPNAAPSPTLAATSSPSSAASAGPAAGTTAAVDSLPPPPPPVVSVVPTNSGSVPPGLLNNAAMAAAAGGSCNNSNSNGGRFSSSAASCGSSAVSQHSSQLSSGESSRSSSPSLDDSSCDSQASEGTQALSEEPDRSPGSSQGDHEREEEEEEEEAALMHSSRPTSPPSEHEREHTRRLERGRRGRRGQGVRSGASLVGRGRSGLMGPRKKTIISPATGILMSSSQVGAHQASSGSSPPPPQQLHPPPGSSSSAAGGGDHHPHSSWIMPRSIAPFLSGPAMHAACHDKRRSILREPTFRWSSAPSHKPECFSSAKYAKEGLIRKPVFDNFRPPPLTAEDVGLVPGSVSGGAPPSGFTASPSGSAGSSSRLFSPLHHHHHQHTSSRFEGSYPKRSPLLRAPRFTPSEAHSRIFESVTLPASSGSSPGSLSPLQGSSPSGRSMRHRKRRTLGAPVSGQPRSPSHSMTRRSSQPGFKMGKSPSDHRGSSSGNASNSTSLTGVAVSPLAPSALTQPPFSTLSSGAAGLSGHGGTDGRKASSAAAPGGLGGVGNSAGSSSSSPSQLFPLFGPGGGGGGGKTTRERNLSAGHEASTKEKDRESERSREREKENKREGRKDRERKGKDTSSHSASGLFVMDGKDLEKSVPTLAHRKTPGRKKSVSADSGAEASPADSNTVSSTPSSNGRPSKKDRPPDWNADADRGGEKEDQEKTSMPLPPGQTGKAPTTNPTLESVLNRAEKQPVADKQLAGLLKKAKAQLHNIEKSLKPVEQPKVQGQESDSSETSVRGPRIKHVCRRAAVALGRHRAVFPDDMPTLSALPWEEREKILSSMGNDDKSSVAGSEEAEPQTPPLKPVTRQKPIHEAQPKKGRRSRRCGQCPGCQVPEDCGVCTNCLDKPKFGGRNIKKQCCKMRKCQNLQWMPSKMFIQKQVKGKKDKKKNRMSEKKELHYSVSTAAPEAKPALREGPSQKKSDALPSKAAEEKLKQQQQQEEEEEEEEEEDCSPTPEPSPPPEEEDPSSPPSTPTPEESKQPPLLSSAPSRKDRKLQQQQQATTSPQSGHKDPSPSPPTPSQSPGQTPPQRSPQNPPHSKKEPLAKPPSDGKKPQQQLASQPPVPDTGPDTKHLKKLAARCAPAPKPKLKEKQEKQVAIKPDGGTLNSLSTPSTGVRTEQQQQTAPCDGVRRIRVDFKESHDIDNVWEMGGLSVLTSVPITPRVLCFLCASSGNVEFVFCQVCCEAFHLFCLGESERPLEAQLENWCCRRCRFCHICGHPHQNTKLLECDKCRNSYHPECLGPNHPTRPTQKKRVWICTKCVRCQSCGATKPGKAWDAQWSHDFSLCHDCAKLVAKGNSCPLCDKCHDDEDYESKMMKCRSCRRWVHAKCESLTDEMYEVLPNLPVAYTCTKCTEKQPAEWRTALKNKLQSSVHQVLTALLNSRTSMHLLRYRQPVMKPPELNPETEESLPSRRSPEGPDPPVLTEVPPHADSPPDLESVEKKMELGRYKSVLEFSDDIVKIIQTAINSDGGQPENKRANSMVKAFFIRKMERMFPWFKVKESRFWEAQKGSNSGLLPNAVLPPFLDHNYAQWQDRMEQSSAERPPLVKIIPAPTHKPPGEPDFPATPPSQPPHVIHELSPEGSPEQLPPPGLGDNRQCVLCLKYGDENTNEGGRLLYIGQNEWTHVNCALWSAEVFEDDDGSLKNVHMAVIRGKQLRCENCQRPGATVGCCLTTCNSNYHFMCARQRRCVFLEDKKVYCQRHKDLIKGEVISDSGFEVTRRILVDLEGISLRRKFINGLPPDNIHMMIGSMTIDCLGMLTDLSDCERNLFPIGYQCSRVYWSTTDARKRCVYTCRILVYRPQVVETVTDSTVSCEKNFTIAHSPSTVPEMEMITSSQLVDSAKLSCSKPVAAASRPKMLFRNRHPSYPPCHKSPISRPLPSPGGFTSSAHEIVTVGDPLLSSCLGRIGSRRHSTSSLSPQSSRNTVVPTAQSSYLFSPQSTASSSSSITTTPLSLSSYTWDRAQRDSGTKGRPFASVRSQNCQVSASSPGSQQRQSGVNEKGDCSREPPGKQSEGEAMHLSAPLMMGMNQVSPPLGTAVLTSHQRSSSSTKGEKGKQQGMKDTSDLPAESTLLSCQPQAALPKDGGNPIQEGTPAAKDTGIPGSPKPPYHKSGGRKSHDYVAGPAPAAAMKPRWSSGATVGEEDIKRGSQATPAVTASCRTSSTKETCSKMGFSGSIEASKEREKTTKKIKTPLQKKGSDIKTLGQDQNFQNSNNKSAVHSSNTKAAGTNAVDKHDSQGGNRPLKSRERFSSESKNSSSLEGMQPETGSDAGIRAALNQTKASKELIKREKKPTGKASLISPKIDPNGTKVISTGSDTNLSTAVTPVSQGPQRRSTCPPVLFSSPSASSESSESESQAHPEDCEEHLREGEGAEDGEDPSMEDEGSIDKHNEEDSDGSGSAKRRYPRRSTRARANMIFGLTPFYGVRSYGEEDIDFYGGGEVIGKKRSGMSKRSAEGQVDGADDMSTSLSEDSGEDEEVGLGPCPNKDSYYYNFTRTIINRNVRLHPEGVGRGSQFGRFLNEDAGESTDHMEESGAIPLSLGRPQIGQLDGVDDGSESDASLSTSSTTTATTSTTHKTSGKRKSRESRAERMAAGSGKDSDSSAGGGNGSSRESRKNQKESCLSLGNVKSQGQDPLEAQLSLTTDLLKSDSDNNYSDDCGNILPSDIMDFVLNTPSMQALGQQPESSSPELLLGEGYGVDVNRRKDSALLFDIPLPSTEPGESNSTISVEESYSLQLGLPSDLSVLTTRSPSVSNQNHNTLIPEASVSNQNHNTLIPEASESTILSLTTDETVEKAGDKPGVRTSEVSEEGGGDSQVTNDQLTPKHFITGIEGEHISNQVSQVIEPDNQDVARTSGTPGLPSSPTLPLQSQKYIPVTAVSPGPSQVASTAVQTPSSHLKPAPEKLIVVNQRMQPLYVLQTLPNGVTQKIQITPSVGTTGVMSTSPSVLSSMTLTAGLPNQPIFPAGGKGLLPMSHHPQIHTLTNTTQASFQPVIPNTTSGLLIGIPSHDSQIIVSEAGRRPDLAPSVTMVSSAPSLSPSSSVLSSGHGKKRPITRLLPRKSKKPPRSRSHPPLAPSEVAPNMTLINLSSPQITAGISTQSGLVELGTLTTATTTSHRKIPNIIKRPKGVMLVPQPMPITSSGQPGILGQDTSTHLLPCTVSGLNPNQQVLNVVSVAPSGAGNILGASSVSLSTPGLLSSTEITGAFSNLLFKAGPHNLTIPDQQMVLHSGGAMMPQLTHPVQTSIASSICVLPPQQTLSMSVSKQVDQESALHRQQVSRILADKPQALDQSGNVAGSIGPAPSLMAQDPSKPVVGVFTQGSWTTPITLHTNQQQVFKSAAPPTAGGKGKQKAKRVRSTPEKASGKKPKGLQAESPLSSKGDASSAGQQSSSGTKQPVNPEPMDTGKPMEKDSNKSCSDAPVTKASPINQVSVELCDEESKATSPTTQNSGKGSGTVLASSEQEDDKGGRDFLSHYKPKKGLMFEISSDDGFQIRCESIEEAWKSLTDKVKEARSNAKLEELSFEGVNGLRMLGVLHHTVVFLLEQLCGAKYCRNYSFRFHKPKECDEPPINPHGSARVELHHRRSVFDMFNFLASKHRQPPEHNPQEEEEEEVLLKSARRAISLDLPMSKRLRHLKKTSWETVGVYRSAIHGRGLFCKRNIDAGEMIIEYSGTIVRSVLTDKREKYYDEKGIGCYMFRIDDYEVVDATMHGNAARFINHSCEPNCFSRVIIVDSQKHIVIFALRKVYRGEELTYDYKFPIEEPGNKLPCNCGAKKCRKFLN